MKIDRIITSCNENKTYSDFIELHARAWKKLCNITVDIAIITTGDSHNSKLVAEAKKYCNVHIFNEHYGVLSSVQAKVSRLILASNHKFNNDICAITDIDMIPLQSTVVKPFEKAADDQLVMWGYDHPAYADHGPDKGKWPMDRTVAKGSTFREIINPNNLSEFEILEHWKNYKLIDGRESINLPFSIFSDESLLRALHSQWSEKDSRTTRLSRNILEKSLLGGRMYPPNEINQEKLKDGTYFEAHGFRPMQNFISHYDEMRKVIFS